MKGGDFMIVSLDFSSETPIYMQIRNQIVIGIGKGLISPGEKLPTTRALAKEAGINTMTVNKAYQLLKKEGHIISDGRNGVVVCKPENSSGFLPSLQSSLELLIYEAKANGISEKAFLSLCSQIYTNEK